MMTREETWSCVLLCSFTTTARATPLSLSLSLFSPQTNTCNLQPWEVSVGSFPPGRRLIGQPGLKFTLVYFWDFGPRVMSSGAFLFYYWKCCKLENMYPWIGLEETTRRKTKGVQGESKENLGWMSLPYSFLCCCLDSGWEVSRVLAYSQSPLETTLPEECNRHASYPLIQRQRQQSRFHPAFAPFSRL